MERACHRKLSKCLLDVIKDAICSKMISPRHKTYRRLISPSNKKNPEKLRLLVFLLLRDIIFVRIISLCNPFNHHQTTLIKIFKQVHHITTKQPLNPTGLYSVPSSSFYNCKNIHYLLWSRGFWRSLNNTYPIFLAPCIRCTNHLRNSCGLIDVNPHFIPPLLPVIQNVDLLWRHRYKSCSPAIAMSQWLIVPAWFLWTLS